MLDWFNPIRAPVEWFKRCRCCDYIGPAHASKDEALAA
jgi:hypothetical protein